MILVRSLLYKEKSEYMWNQNFIFSFRYQLIELFRKKHDISNNSNGLEFGLASSMMKVLLATQWLQKGKISNFV